MTGQGHRILVVDDDPEMCGMLSEVLHDEGYSVHTTDGSLEALNALKKEEFDVIITDLKMKGLKGLDLLEEEDLNMEKFDGLLKEATRWSIEIDKKTIGFVATSWVNSIMERLRQQSAEVALFEK